MPDARSASWTSGLPLRNQNISDVRSWDFPSGALPTWAALWEDTPSGTATAGGVDRQGGWYTAIMTADSEAQEIALRPSLNADGSTVNTDLAPQYGCIIEAVFQLPILPSAANEDFIFGIVSDRHDTVDSIARHLLFRATANGSLLVNVDDGTTDAAADTGLDLTAATTFKLRIHTARFGLTTATTFKVGFSVALGDDADFVPVLTSTTEAWTLDFGTNLSQWIVEMQKNTAATLLAFEIDRIDYFQDKSY